MKFEISETGKKMLALQEKLADDYKYKPQEPIIAENNMQTYIENLPSCFIPAKDGESFFAHEAKKGYEIEGKDMPIVSKDGTMIASRYDRIVIGHYGAFIEIDPKDMIMENIKCKEGQEYRISNPYFTHKVKYQWMTTLDDSDCKLYFQQRPVTYADYQPQKWYISPYEVCDEEELRILGMDKLKEEYDAYSKETDEAFKGSSERNGGAIIYTGYFAKIKEYKENGLVPISISRWSPKWYNGEECKDLAPSAELLARYKDGKVSEEEYTKEYKAMLDTMDVKDIVEKAAKGRDVVFCCYEKSSDFCHRHLLADYLQEKYGMKVSEQGIKEQYEQLSLEEEDFELEER